MTLDNQKINIAVVGATGRIGADIIDLLSLRNFKINKLFAVASKKSAGSHINFQNKQIIVQDLENFDFSEIDIAFFAIDDDNSLKYIEIARSKGVHVIDNSSAFRMKEDAILIVPEVNGEEIDKGYVDFINSENNDKGLLICNPNCCVIPLVVALKSFENSCFKPIRASVSTYQSVSGAGKAAMDELFANTKANFGPGFSKKSEEESVFEYEISFNCIPKIGQIDNETGYTSEEIKIIEEPRKILKSMKIFNDLKINATCVRVPVFVGHCESIDIQFDDKNINLEDFNYQNISEIIDQNDFIDFYPNETNHVLTPRDCIKRDEVLACRLRIDKSVKAGISLFLVSDNLHKGGALNAVQIAERLIHNMNT
jgi:aspartate-semialdehyde dehydrogenase